MPRRLTAARFGGQTCLPLDEEAPNAHQISLAVLCLPALSALAACATQAPVASRPPIYAADIAGKAAECTAPAVKVSDGKNATGTIATGGGGWCGIIVTRDGQPLTAALLTQPPHAGKVYVHTVSDETRVDYTPTEAAVADGFTVKFIPGDETMEVTVVSTAHATPAPAAKGVTK